MEHARRMHATPEDEHSLRILRQTEFFSTASAPELHELASGGEWRRYNRRQVILGVDDKRDSLVVLAHGSARLVPFCSGDVYGLSYLSGDVEHCRYLEATEDAVVAGHLPGVAARAFIRLHPIAILAAIELPGQHLTVRVSVYASYCTMRSRPMCTTR